jgi:hypothetical protein
MGFYVNTFNRLAAILSMSMMAFTTTSAQQSEKQGGPMPVSISSSGPGPGGGGGDNGGGGGGDDDDDDNGNATRPTIDVTAINNTATLALDDLEELLTSLESNANITRRSVITDLEAIQVAFQNIQGNLSGIIPAVQDEADIR